MSTTKPAHTPHIPTEIVYEESPVGKCSRAVGKATRADLTRLKRIGRNLPPHATCRVGIPAADRGEHRDNRVTLRCPTQQVARKRDARHLEDACVLVNTPLATWSSSQKVVSLSSAESEYYSMVRCAGEVIGLANTICEL